ncbi:hypothetical protein CC1G_14766 [Coprinopsis cinerea okayama7|uniref:Uncharacterized protein n=1 Tax=Coprinopsis cinerea (strain Okayama-7 / 130 / ATCC MYA-4618 / FGSC 9003) TaxID=240176 RepID=D6RNM9_COPC7|nr:hypothetical protein CC1G_14766 [Coprinopsis cinerea okayama7\|eukprot:XP_002910788.1 hypothetical protein CC1G_14766 [Coprinopsis cinerea okayama7\
MGVSQKTKGELKSVSERVQALEDTVAELRQRTAKEREIQVQLQRAQDLRATESQTACALAQREAEEHRAAAMTWQEKANLLSTKLEETQEQLRASEEQVKKLLPCADVEALQRELNLLRAANADLVSRSDDVMGRYKRGELTDGERELVQYVVELTETSNEQRIIEKENEIRDRVNQLAACQARIKLLQRRVAEMLEKNGAEARPLLNIRSLAVEGPSKHDRPQSPETPPRIQVEEPSFTKLAQETASDDYNGHSPLTDLSQISQFSDKAKKRPRPKSLVSSEAAVVRKRPIWYSFSQAKDTSKQPSMGNVNAGPKSGSSKKVRSASPMG